MALKKKPVTGMNDMLPREMEIRDYVIQMIKDTYRTFGFSAIETPCVEHIENLLSKQGGENEQLIFKISSILFLISTVHGSAPHTAALIFILSTTPASCIASARCMA